MATVVSGPLKNYVYMGNGGTFTVPAGVARLTAIGSGGGGGGGGGGSGAVLSAGARGGAGGFTLATAVEFDVTPGETLTCVVGAGGNGGAGGNSGGPGLAGVSGVAGTPTSVSRGATLIASFPGGAAGAGGAAGGAGAGGVGSSGTPATIGFNALIQSNTFGSSTLNLRDAIDVSGLGVYNFSRNGGSAGAYSGSPTVAGAGSAGVSFLVAGGSGGSAGSPSGSAAGTGGGGGGSGFLLLAW